jgi:hypothetical protein
MKQLPIVTLEIDGQRLPYYLDDRLREYRSVNGAPPWIVTAADVKSGRARLLEERDPFVGDTRNPL